MYRIIGFLLLLVLIMRISPAVHADTGFGLVPERKTTDNEAAQALIDLLPLEDYSLLSPDEVSGERLFQWYKAAYETGKVPLIIAADDNLAFTIAENLKDKSLEAIAPPDASVPRPAIIPLPEGAFSNFDMLLSLTEEWLLATLRADAPWQALHLVPFGGWNECPPPADQAIALRGWQQRYGALPFIITADTLGILLNHPPKGPAETLPLADELLDFCPELEMAYESPEALAEALIDDPLWFFWWD